MANITLRNTISGVSAVFPANYARRLLADPILGKHQVEVDTDKPEVLSRPYEVDADGNRSFKSPEDDQPQRGADRQVANVERVERTAKGPAKLTSSDATKSADTKKD